jgi:hypothetical protein
MPELMKALCRKPELIQASGGFTLSDDMPNPEVLILGSPSFTVTAAGVEGPLWPLWWQALAEEAKEAPSVVVDVPSSEP